MLCSAAGSLPAHLRFRVVLGGFSSGFALGRQRPGSCALFVCGHGVFVVAALYVGVSEQEIVNRVGARSELHCLRELGPGVVILLMVDVEQPQTAVGQREFVILCLLE